MPHPSSALLFHLGALGLGVMLTHAGEDLCFSQSTDGNAGLLKKTLTDTPKHVSPAIWASIGGLVNKLCPTLTTPWTVARRAPLSMEFSRQEYWTRLPFPFPGDLPDPGIKPKSLMSPALAGRFFTTSATWEAQLTHLPRVKLVPSS